MSKKFWGDAPETGEYTPTLSGVANIDTATVQKAYFTKIGDMCSVIAYITVNVTALEVIASLNMSLPIESDIANNFNLLGSLTPISTASITRMRGEMGNILGDTVDDSAIIYFTPTTNDAYTYIATFQYKIIE